MPLSVNVAWGSLANPYNIAELIAFVQSITVNLSGSVANSDISAGAVTADKATPGAWFYGTGAFTAGTYAVTSSGTALGSLVAGALICFVADLANTGATNLNVDGLGSKDFLKPNGAELDEGDIPAGSLIAARYNGTAWQLIGCKGRPDRIYAGTAGGTANALTATLTPSALSLADLNGREIEVTVASANTGAATFQVNALVAKAITKRGGAALVGYELAAGQVIRLQYDGTQYQLLTPVATPEPKVRDDVRNLLITGSGNTAAITADSLVVSDSSNGGSHLLQNVVVNLDITTAGANGLDTGAVANVGYCLWVIYNPVTATVAGLFSTTGAGLFGGVETFPTLPAGYTHAAFVGRCMRSAGSIIRFVQKGKRCSITESLVGPLMVGTIGTYLAADASAVVPLSGIKTIRGYLGDTAGTTYRMTLAESEDGVNFVGVQQFGGETTGATAFGTASLRSGKPFEIGVKQSTNIYYSVGAGTIYLVVTGWELN